MMLVAPAHSHADHEDHYGHMHDHSVHEHHHDHNQGEGENSEQDECLVCCIISHHSAGAVLAEDSACPKLHVVANWVAPVLQNFRALQSLSAHNARAPPFS
ncbi:MAG: DUF2946 family protein [Aquisalinus sp.]|nr:DUF2946 family protein [Aquisalinus sp.]